MVPSFVHATDLELLLSDGASMDESGIEDNRETTTDRPHYITRLMTREFK